VFYDYKQYLLECDASIPHELNRHPLADLKPGDALQGKAAKKFGGGKGGVAAGGDGWGSRRGEVVYSSR